MNFGLTHQTMLFLNMSISTYTLHETDYLIVMNAITTQQIVNLQIWFH